MSPRRPDMAPLGPTRRRRRLALPLILGLLCAASCAGTTPVTLPGTGAVWGQMRLVPREGVTPGSRGSGAYSSPALRNVRFVDYSRPGFAVVYVDGPTSPRDSALIVIRDSRHFARLQPKETAVGQAGSIVIVNETSRVQAVSAPAAGNIYRIGPGQRVEISQPASGLHSLYLLESAEVTARVFVAPGPYAVVSSRGKFRLDGLRPGKTRLHTWHPYFPATERQIDVPRDGAVRVDLEIGVMANERRSSDAN